MISSETVRRFAAKSGRKRSINSAHGDEPPHKKATDDVAHRIPFPRIPFMIRVQICSYLDLPNQKNLSESCPEGKEAVMHFWRAQRRLDFSAATLKVFFPNMQDCDRWLSIFQLGNEVVELFARLQNSAIRELDLRSVQTVDWPLFDVIVQDDHGPGCMAQVLAKVTKLRLEGCYLSSDDIHAAVEVLPNLEAITLTDRTFTLYEDVDGPLPNALVRGKTNKRRSSIAKLLKHCFPRLRIIRFY